MDDRDMEIIKLRQDLAKWMNRALECGYEACSRCENRKCENCRVQKIMQEAEK